MTMAQQKYIDFADICVTVYVRQQLSEERVQLFADLYTSSAAGTVPPIIVTEDNKLIDGRHRIQALKFLGEKGCVCVVERCKDSFEITMSALKANVGGSKELTMADVRQTIIRLMDEQHSQKKIIASLPFPKELGRKLVRAAFSLRVAQRATAAAREVESGAITTSEAARKYLVTAHQITRRTVALKKKEAEGDMSNVGSVKGSITTRYYNLSKKMGNYLKRLAERYEAGDFTEAQVLEILAHVLHQARGHVGAMNDWNDRFSVMVKTRRPILPDGRMPNKKFDVTERTSVSV